MEDTTTATEAKKRKHAPDNEAAINEEKTNAEELLFVPQEDLTALNFGTQEYGHLTDRQLFAWAYQTETRVRFQKLEGRSNNEAGISSNDNGHYSKTLNSEYLIDVYPYSMDATKEEDPQFLNFLERDRIFYKRKALKSLVEPRELDGTLTRVYIVDEDAKAVPPNYLFFLIVLEGYCGYELQGLYNSEDPDMPRAAIMGGAVVAALSSWRDIHIRYMFNDIQAMLDSENEPENEQEQETFRDNYEWERKALVSSLNGHFLGVHASKFALGDVDIFLQASPHTQKLFHVLSDHAGSPEIVENVVKYASGLGICQEDLHRYTRAFLDKLNPKFEGDGQFVHALTKRALSLLFTNNRSDDDEVDWQEPGKIWPRCTQLIMLDPCADLVGAVMDFDLSLTSCAFDGTTVRVTPRAALSLVRKLLVVTPFCYEERRNQQRMIKYHKRGFLMGLIDPNCLHPTECMNFNIRIQEQQSLNIINENRRCAEGEISLRTYQNIDEYNETVTLLQEHEHLNNPCCCNAYTVKYSFTLMEKSEGDATEFFAKKFSWSDEKRAQVEMIPNHLRQACRKCRLDYKISLFLTEETPVETVEDALHGEKCLKIYPLLEPSFYSGGAFNSKHVKNSARNDVETYSALHAQKHAERIRYLLKNGGSEAGYQERFIFDKDGDLDELFAEASTTQFSDSGRAPVGLNPERFIARCKACSKWLHGCEYHVKYCSSCGDRKPPSR